MILYSQHMRLRDNTRFTPEQIRLADNIFLVCERNYDLGGDVIVECFDTEDVLNQFSSVAEVKEYCRAKVEQALNCRWGSDDDPQFETYRRFNESNWEVVNE